MVALLRQAGHRELSEPGPRRRTTLWWSASAPAPPTSPSCLACRSGRAAARTCTSRTEPGWRRRLSAGSTSCRRGRGATCCSAAQPSSTTRKGSASLRARPRRRRRCWRHWRRGAERKGVGVARLVLTSRPRLAPAGDAALDPRRADRAVPGQPARTAALPCRVLTPSSAECTGATPESAPSLPARTSGTCLSSASCRSRCEVRGEGTAAAGARSEAVAAPPGCLAGSARAA